MSESPVYRPHPEDRAVATLRRATASDAWEGLDAHHFEIVSRGDFVHGTLMLPTRPPSSAGSPDGAPLLLLLHGAPQGMDSDELIFAASWVKQGLAVAMIDMPLHGKRASLKLSERLFSGVENLIGGSTLDPETGALVEEFARQTTSDLIRTLDGLAALPAIDCDRIAFMGFRLGAIAGAYLLAHDPRPRAAVLAMAGGGFSRTEIDPSRYLANVAGNQSNRASILFVAADDDPQFSASASEALFHDAQEPKELIRFAGPPQQLPGDVIAKTWQFLAKALGL